RAFAGRGESQLRVRSQSLPFAPRSGEKVAGGRMMGRRPAPRHLARPETHRESDPLLRLGRMPRFADERGPIDVQPAEPSATNSAVLPKPARDAERLESPVTVIHEDDAAHVRVADGDDVVADPLDKRVRLNVEDVSRAAG